MRHAVGRVTGRAGRTLTSVADDVEKAHRAWRKAEEDYAQAAAPFLKSVEGSGTLSKKSAISLAELRSRADHRMQRYFKKAL